MFPQFVHQPRQAIVEAVTTVLDRVHTRAHTCPHCILGMLLDELGFQEHEFVAAGISLSCIYASKTVIDWEALMYAIKMKRRSSNGHKRPYWLSEALKSGWKKGDLKNE